jgi:hypothetical protein
MADLLRPVDLQPVPVSRVDASFRHSGVYFLFHAGEVVYVGQSNSVLRRIGEHMSDCRKAFDSVAFIACQALNRLWLEAQYIERFRPRYNQPEIQEIPELTRKRRSGRRSAQRRNRRKFLAEQSAVYQA